MKELSIEEKAKRYDEALKRADKVSKGHADDREPGITICEYIFPELKDDEDEKIRKWLIDWVNAVNYWSEQFTVTREQIIAWLEKQKNTQDKEYVFRPFAGEAIEKAAERAVELDGKVVLAFNGAYIPVGNKTKGEIVAEYRNWIEKQGEHKPYGQRKECEDCQFNYAGECKGSCQMKRDEQKPTDKVEPKFHEGDWITNGQLTCKVLGVVGKSYELHLYNDDYCHFETDVQSVDEDYHLWTIRDAKDGDLIYVSTEEKGIQAIFHEYKNDTIFFHCYLCTDFVQGGYMPIGSVELIYPLQKTHYSRFFEKMHKAGYEWDNEKKELKQSADEAESKFHEGDWIIDNEYGEVLKVTKSDANSYEITNQDGEVFDILKEDVECNHRLWSIDDAKRGDVLVDVYGNIGIFDKCYDFDWMSCCSLGNNGGFQYFTVEHENEKTYPAIKEQRDLFFSKMKEEGWEWDSENKELKKNL